MADRLTALELDNVLKGVGFADAEKRRIAWAVAMRESRGTPGIIGGPNPNGSYDYGLFQINDIHKSDAIDWSKILDVEHDGAYNASLAFRWTGGGVNWGTWGLGDQGWAGSLKRNNPEIWEQVQRDFQTQYNAYPAAMAAAVAALSKPGVRLVNLVPGVKLNADVRTYQTALRKFLGPVLAAQLNPSGATGNYGNETKAMTTKAYQNIARTTGQVSWLKGDLTTPGAGLIDKIGLRVIKP